MPCYRPIPASQPFAGAAVKLWPPLGEQHLAIPCGNCIGCKSARAAAWGKRCEHEMTRWQYNTFITLTYDDDNLPPGGHLSPRDLQLFIKRLRKSSSATRTILHDPKSARLSYLACGEYGSITQRAHYHILTFNCDFADKHQTGQHGEHLLYESDTLHTLWRYGKANFGTATGASANYIAQYTLKSHNKHYLRRKYDDHEGWIDLTTGEWHPALRPAHNRIIPPFLRMSLKPAIGAEWVKQYADDMRKGFLTSNGHKYAIPRTYREALKKSGDERYDAIELAIHENKTIETPEQLRAHELIHTRLKALTNKRRL